MQAPEIARSGTVTHFELPIGSIKDNDTIAQLSVNDILNNAY